MLNKTVKGQNATAIQVKRCLRGHGDFIHQIAWSPDGQSVAAVSRDKTIRIWDTVTGEGKLLPRDDQELEIFGVAWSPNGESLASWSAGANT
jgi:WD40 repeat protein